MADAKVENIETEKKVEEIEDDSDDDVPELEGAENPGKGKQSRGEKKTRKALQKLGLKDVEGITKVTVRKGRQVLFVVNSPNVYKSPNAETYIVFGTAQEASDDVSSLQAAQLAEQLSAGGFGGAAASGASVSEVAESGDASDETGLNAKDIELVMSQGNVDRATAVKALKKTGGDMVAAIMELTVNK
eukprot:TRINITY_DN2059_c0_g1_i1.p3 TRINITY_DN2059_c0_g1~~TRINITY_DN2059_c0_g1_i1.p3  ORF type:complete len:188 (+),score=83.50 TRINITY_DN2059_c0_g1_i1:993-1556(+)